MKPKKQKEKENNDEIDYIDLKFQTNFEFERIESRLITYIQIANRRVDQYSHERRLSLQINLTILLAVSAIFSSFFNVLNDNVKIITSIFYILYLILSIVNIIYSLSSHKTKFKPRPLLERMKDFFSGGDIDQYWITNSYYRGNVPKNVNQLKNSLIKFAKKFGLKESETVGQNINIRESLIKDEIKNLYILFWYQSNYYRLARWTRIFTLWGIILVVFGLILTLFFSLN